MVDGRETSGPGELRSQRYWLVEFFFVSLIDLRLQPSSQKWDELRNFRQRIGNIYQKKTGKRVKFLSQIIAAFVNNPPWIRATHEEE